MIQLNETMMNGSLACAYEGHKEPSGTYYVNPLLANVSKRNVTQFPYEIAKLAQEVAGGSLVTMPSEKDLKNPKIGKYVAKYLSGVEGIGPEERIRALRLIENITLGTGAVGYLTESMHGAGSPQAQSQPGDPAQPPAQHDKRAREAPTGGQPGSGARLYPPG